MGHNHMLIIHDDILLQRSIRNHTPEDLVKLPVAKVSRDLRAVVNHELGLLSTQPF